MHRRYSSKTVYKISSNSKIQWSYEIENGKNEN